MSILYIKKVSGKGRGVFSRTPIVEGEIIEQSPLLVMPGEDYDRLTQSVMVNYCFFFDREKKMLGLATGFSSMYNHQSPSNATHSVDPSTKLITITAVRNIEANEEICINYNGSFDNDSLDWFQTRNLLLKQ